MKTEHNVLTEMANAFMGDVINESETSDEKLKKLMGEDTKNEDDAFDVEPVDIFDLAKQEPAATPKKRLTTIEKVKKIVDEHQYAKIGGKVVDGTTANVILKVYNAITDEELKKKFADLPILKMVDIAWKMIK